MFNRPRRLHLARTALLGASSLLLLPVAASAQATPANAPVRLIPSSLWFGQQAIGVPSQSKTVTVLNNASSGATLNFSSIAAVGDYSQTNNCPGSLAPGGSCSVTIVFTPSDRGRREGGVVIQDDAPGGQQQVNAAGTGLRVSVEVRPHAASAQTSQPQQFVAVGSNTNNGDVLWSVDGVTGGTSSSGTISGTGLYTAPGQAGGHTIRAVSQLDPSKNAAAQVTVAQGPGGPPPSGNGVVADFNSGAPTAYPIPAGLLGAGLGGDLHPDSLPLITQAGLTTTRFHANVQDTFATSTADWSELDAKLSALKGAGMQAILEMDFTPNSLLPSPNPCRSGVNPNYAYPTDLSQYSQMAAAYVTHINNNFPGVVSDYEIWNEPDGGGLCAPQRTEKSKLDTYLSIYAAVAPALRAAAGQTPIRIGGATLGDPFFNANTWLPALLSNPATAPYVDFVSAHYYASGRKEANSGMTWDGAGGSVSLFNRTQSYDKGIAAAYLNLASLVSQGSQPNAASTPIYLDEYNSDWAFQDDCCRNDATYAPLWNSVAIVDLLNTVYSGAAAVPNKVLYYAISNHPFCLLGVIDAQMGCHYPYDGSAPQPYPQYYALKLFGANAFLGLQSGGYMAKSVSSAYPNLLATAFVAGGADTIVLVNPRSSDANGVSVTFQNPGVGGNATLYTLNSSNPAIAATSVALSPANNGQSATVSVPSHSVVAVSVHP